MGRKLRWPRFASVAGLVSMAAAAALSALFGGGMFEAALGAYGLALVGYDLGTAVAERGGRER